MEETRLQEINLLPFHRMGDSKWSQLGERYDYRDAEVPSDEELQEMQKLFFAERALLLYCRGCKLLTQEDCTMSSITERIQQANLTKKERTIIEKITRDIEKTAFLNGIGLAERYDVSATFITRLIQKLGYEKFADFKKELRDRYQRMTFPKDMYRHFLEGGGGNIVKASITRDVQNISNMETLLDKKMLNKVVSAIERSDTVYMVAMFGSEIAVDALFYYLGRLGMKRRKVKGVGLSKRLNSPILAKTMC